MTQRIPQSGPREWIGWLLRRRRLVRVTGRSMLPLLQPGDLLFVDPHAYRKSLPQVNEIVVAFHPYQSELKIIKRVSAVLPNERYFLSSDNALEGSDSRTFGSLSLGNIVGKVTGVAIHQR